METYRALRFESLVPRHLLTAISLVSQPPIVNSVAVLTALDMDADGDQDIIVLNEDSLVWLENQSENGEVRFEEHPISDLTSRLFDTVDLDGDQDVDLIVEDPTNGVSILENTDDGFVMRQIIEIPPELLAPRLVRAVDIDGDGDQDLVVNTPGFLGGGGELSWYANDGAGDFELPRVVIMEGPINALTLADLDGDNDQDFVFSTISDTPLSFLGWIENIDKGTKFETNLSLLRFGSVGANDIQAYDQDNDGDLDLVTANGDGVLSYENIDGLGSFAEAVNIYDAAATWSVAVADLDGDGRDDIVTTRNSPSGGITVLNRNVDEYEATTSSSENVIGGMLLADVDLDGKVDILRFGEGGWFRNQLAGDLNNDRHVGFEDFLILAANYGKSDARMSEGDLNGDMTISFADFLILSKNFGNVRT